jgi:hypothetical protein
MRKALRADLLAGTIRQGDEKEGQVPEMRQREGRAADLGGGSENFEKELMDGSGSVSSRSLTLFEMTDPLHCCHFGFSTSSATQLMEVPNACE